MVVRWARMAVQRVRTLGVAVETSGRPALRQVNCVAMARAVIETVARGHVFFRCNFALSMHGALTGGRQQKHPSSQNRHCASADIALRSSSAPPCPPTTGILSVIPGSRIYPFPTPKPDMPPLLSRPPPRREAPLRPRPHRLMQSFRHPRPQLPQTLPVRTTPRTARRPPLPPPPTGCCVQSRLPTSSSRSECWATRTSARPP